MGHLNKWQARCRNVSSLCIHCKRYSSILSRILVSPEAWSTFVYTSISSQYATFNLDCENSYLVLLYYQDFQWSSIQLSLSLDNVVSCSVFHITKHCEHLIVPLQIDTLPCEPTEDELQAALMQFLSWVCIIMYIIHVCWCVYILFLLHS